MNFSEAVDNDDDKLCGDGYGTERDRECQEKQKLGVQVFWFFVYIIFWKKMLKKKKSKDKLMSLIRLKVVPYPSSLGCKKNQSQSPNSLTCWVKFVPLGLIHVPVVNWIFAIPSCMESSSFLLCNHYQEHLHFPYQLHPFMWGFVECLDLTTIWYNPSICQVMEPRSFIWRVGLCYWYNNQEKFKAYI